MVIGEVFHITPVVGSLNKRPSSVSGHEWVVVAVIHGGDGGGDGDDDSDDDDGDDVSSGDERRLPS